MNLKIVEKDLSKYSNTDKIEFSYYVGETYHISKFKNIKHVRIVSFSENLLPILSMYWIESLKISISDSGYFKKYYMLENAREKRPLISLKNFVNLTELITYGVFCWTDLRHMKKLERLRLGLATGMSTSDIYNFIGNILQLNLKHLDLKDVFITDDMAFFISQIQTLEYFIFQPAESDFTKEGVRHLSNLKNLKEFVFRLGYEYIKEFTSLETIIIKWSDDDKQIGKELKDIVDLPKLKMLIYQSKNEISDLGLYYIGQNTSISDISGIPITERNLYHFQNLELKYLNIVKTTISSKLFVEIRNGLLFETIEYLSLSKVRINDKTIRKIMLLSKLETLHIFNCTVTNKMFDSITSNLKTLRVQSKYYESPRQKLYWADESSSESEYFKNEKNDVRYKLTGDALKYLSLGNYPNLECLSLYNFRLNNEDFNHFKNFKMPSLNTLMLNKCRGFDETGMKIFGSTNISKQLKELSLKDVNININYLTSIKIFDENLKII